MCPWRKDNSKNISRIAPHTRVTESYGTSPCAKFLYFALPFDARLPTVYVLLVQTTSADDFATLSWRFRKSAWPLSIWKKIWNYRFEKSVHFAISSKHSNDANSQRWFSQVPNTLVLGKHKMRRDKLNSWGSLWKLRKKYSCTKLFSYVCYRLVL